MLAYASRYGHQRLDYLKSMQGDDFVDYVSALKRRIRAEGKKGASFSEMLASGG